MDTLIINHGAGESRVATLNRGVVADIAVERPQQSTQVGNIYLGKIVRLVAGMAGAFVAFGGLQEGFLPFDKGSHLPRLGEFVLVQVVKDAYGNKGVRLSLQISLASRSLIYLPKAKRKIALSNKLTDNTLRQTLSRVVGDYLSIHGDIVGGFIIRTNAQYASHSTLTHELAQLATTWHDIQSAIKIPNKQQKPRLIQAVQTLPFRVLCDTVQTSDRLTVVCDEQHLLDKLQQFARGYPIDWQYYAKATPIFTHYALDKVLNTALDRQVALPCGGHLTIDRTEALTVIDVNSGTFIGKDISSTARITNEQAVTAIAREIRLRALSGMIVVDFISVKDTPQRHHLWQLLQQAFADDPIKTTLYPLNELDLMVINRERTGKSLLEQLCTPCPTCHGTGYQKSLDTIGFEVIRQLLSYTKSHPTIRTFTLKAHPVVINYLQNNDKLQEVLALIDGTIALKNEPKYAYEQVLISQFD